MSNRLKDKIIIVTGGNGLLGKAIVRAIKDEGAFCINFDINHKTNDDLSNVECDITEKDSIDYALSLVIAKYNKIDGLVNNAYPKTKDWGNKFEDIKYESWKKNVDLQLGSVFLCCKLVLQHMKKNNYGSVVNIASIYGVIGPEFSIYEGTSLTTPAAYSAIKGGVINFSRYLASYYGKYGLRVNCVSPGGIYNNQNKKFVHNYIKNVPLKRMGIPSDISPAVSFLLSEDSSYVTGQNLIVDGGWTCK